MTTRGSLCRPIDLRPQRKDSKEALRISLVVPRMLGKEGKSLIWTNMIAEWPAHHQDTAMEINSFVKTARSNMKQQGLRCQPSASERMKTACWWKQEDPQEDGTALKVFLARGPGNGKESRVQTWKEVEETEMGSGDANVAAVRKTKPNKATTKTTSKTN